MAEITKVALKVDNNSSFPNNNAGAITPTILRAFNTNMIDSLVDEIGYTADSSSWNAQIAAISGAAVVSTGSLLVTASFNNGTRDLTFTKGNATTFAVNIPDVSGSTINTGSFVTTSSFNAYTASQSTASLVTSITNLNTFTSSQLTINTAIGASTASLNSFTASQNTKNTTLATYTASVTISLTNLNTYTASAAISTTNLNSFTASQNTKDTTLATYTASVDTKFTAVGVSTSSLNTATASLFTSASLSLTTASFSGNTLTFRKGDGTTFGIVLPDVSGSTIPTGTISGSAQITAFGFVSSSVTASSLVSASVSLNTITFTKGDASTFNITVNTGSATSTDITSLNSFTASQETKDTTLASVTASLNSATASLFTSASLGLTTASFSGNTLTFTKGDTTTFGIVLPDVSGSTINTGSFATTGSNTFIGNETFQDAAGNASTLVPTSGSLMLVAKSFTSASSHISGTANLVNLIFKNSDATADTIISGSGNMFINPAAPTAGFKRYVGGSGNIALNGSNVAQISSSMAFSPTMNNNYFGGNSLGLIMRGPVSSSTYTISGNNVLGTINIGSSAALHAEKLVSGLTMNANSIGGTLTLVANQSSIGSTTFANNIIAGGTTLNLSSSAASIQNNIINDSAFTFTNQFYSSSLGLGSVPMNRNNIGGQSNSIIISGSLPSGTTTTNSISDNFIFGGSNTIYIDVQNARVSGSTAYINVIRTGLMGNNLIVSGSSLLADASSYGSVFVGRYNANDNIRNKTSDTVFAVGTGNSTTRKTGFLIDSGSNTFIEGTLNVSGATSLNGDLIITGSLTASLQQGYVYVGNASGITTTAATSSFGGATPAGTISGSQQITALGFVSSSITASSLVTASVSLNTITFTKGDATTFALTVNTGSGGGGAAFPFTGDAVITGSLGISGSMFGGVIPITVVSSTASIDFSKGNMFTLALPSASTHIVPTNIRAGQTCNIQITQPTPGTGSVLFSPLVLFAGGNDYQATTTGSAVDMLSLVSFNGTNTIATSIKNFL